MQMPSSLAPEREESLLRSWLGASLMAIVTAITAQFSAHVPGTPIPVVMVVFSVLLTGLILPKRWAMVAMAQYLALGLLGAPVFADHRFGPAPFFGVTGGYLISYPIAVFLMAALRERLMASRPPDAGEPVATSAAACAVGLLTIYTLGTVQFALVSRQLGVAAILQGALIFLAWDCVKGAAAVSMASALRRGR